MKVVFLLKEEPDRTVSVIIEEARRRGEVMIIDLREEQEYDALVETVATCDLAMSW